LTRLNAAALPSRVAALLDLPFAPAEPLSLPNAPATLRVAGWLSNPWRLLSSFFDVDVTPDLFDVWRVDADLAIERSCE